MKRELRKVLGLFIMFILIFEIICVGFINAEPDNPYENKEKGLDLVGLSYNNIFYDKENGKSFEDLEQEMKLEGKDDRGLLASAVGRVLNNLVKPVGYWITGKKMDAITKNPFESAKAVLSDTPIFEEDELQVPWTAFFGRQPRDKSLVNAYVRTGPDELEFNPEDKRGKEMLKYMQDDLSNTARLEKLGSKVQEFYRHPVLGRYVFKDVKYNADGSVTASFEDKWDFTINGDEQKGENDWENKVSKIARKSLMKVGKPITVKGKITVTPEYMQQWEKKKGLPPLEISKEGGPRFLKWISENMK